MNKKNKIPSTHSAATDKSIVVNIDAPHHVTGKSIYVDDIPVMEVMLYIKVFDASIAHGKIKKRLTT